MHKFEQTEEYQGHTPAKYIYRAVKIEHTFEIIDGVKVHKSVYKCPIFHDEITAHVPPQRVKGWIDLALDNDGTYIGIRHNEKYFDPDIYEVLSRAVERGYNVSAVGNGKAFCVYVSKGNTRRSKTLILRPNSKVATVVESGVELKKPLKNKSDMLAHLRIPALKKDQSKS